MRFSSLLIACVYLGFATAAVLLVAPGEPTPAPSRADLPIDAADLRARNFPDVVTGAGAPALPTKVPRGNSNLVGNVFDAADQGEKGGKKGGGISIARRQEAGVEDADEEDPEATHTVEDDEPEGTLMLLPAIAPPNPTPPPAFRL